MNKKALLLGTSDGMGQAATKEALKEGLEVPVEGSSSCRTCITILFHHIPKPMVNINDINLIVYALHERPLLSLHYQGKRRGYMPALWRSWLRCVHRTHSCPPTKSMPCSCLPVDFTMPVISRRKAS